ncbi:hypothetical protein GQ53DRAFT_801316 [Thozetella sp. PMI_491]|nr:hypothetical protein GQ53DRAFT_801316 [Thozetella sp. PMI_491]
MSATEMETHVPAEAVPETELELPPPADPVSQPPGWMYKGVRIGGLLPLPYCTYAPSFLHFNHKATRSVTTCAGVFLGACGSLLLTAQGTIMMSYSPEEKKGRYISYFWIMYNMGAVLGSLVRLGENLNSKTGSVTDGTYVCFTVQVTLGAILALFWTTPTPYSARRQPDHPHGAAELAERSPWIVLLCPIAPALLSSGVWTVHPYNAISSERRLLGAALVFAASVILLKVRDTVTLEKDIKFNYENTKDIVPSNQLKRVVAAH